MFAILLAVSSEWFAGPVAVAAAKLVDPAGIRFKRQFGDFSSAISALPVSVEFRAIIPKRRPAETAALLVVIVVVSHFTQSLTNCFFTTLLGSEQNGLRQNDLGAKLIANRRNL